MKKALLVLSVLFVFAGFFVCDAAALNAKGHIDLKLNFRKGEKRDMKMTQNMKITQTMQGAEMKMNQLVETLMGFEVKAIDANGVGDIIMTYKAMKIVMDMNSAMAKTKIEYDSANPSPDSNDPATKMISDMFSSMVGSSIKMKVGPKGEVHEMKGLSKMMEKVFEKLGPESAGVKQMVNGMFDEKKMKDTMSGIFGSYPDGLVAVGDTWDDLMNLDVGFPIDLETTYILKKREKGMAYIDNVAKMDMGTEKKIDVQGMKMGFDFTGVVSNSAVVDEVSGWMLSSNGVINMTGVIKMDANPQMPEGMVIPMSIEGTIKVETVDVM